MSRLGPLSRKYLAGQIIPARLHHGQLIAESEWEAQGHGRRWRAKELDRVRGVRLMCMSIGLSFAAGAVFYRALGVDVMGAVPFAVLGGIALIVGWFAERRVQRLAIEVVTDRLLA